MKFEMYLLVEPLENTSKGNRTYFFSWIPRISLQGASSGNKFDSVALHDDDDGSTFKTLYLDRCPRCSCWSRLAGQPWGPIDPWDTRRSLWSLQQVVNKSQTCPKVYCLKETQKQTHRRPRLSFTPRNKVGVCTSYDVSRLSLHADKSSDQTEPEWSLCGLLYIDLLSLLFDPLFQLVLVDPATKQQ